MKHAIFLAFGIVISAAFAAGAQTYAERLGWGPTDRVIIFHIDDAGMSHSSNVGTVEALEYGIATSTSVMYPCGWVPELAQYVAAHSSLDVGVHLTLTAEWQKYRWSPLAGLDAVPGLVDEQGCLWHSVEEVLSHATPEEFDAEIRAQLARAETVGMPITHLDSHMGTCFASPEYFQKYVNLGIEKNIPVMLPAGHLTSARAEQGQELIDSLLASGAVEAVWNAGLPLIDDLHTASLGSNATEKIAYFSQVLRDMPPGITQFIIHCTRPTEEFAFISASGNNRLAELELMLSPEIQQVIAEEGIIITTWRELKERRDALEPKTVPVAKVAGVAALGSVLLAAGLYLVPTRLKHAQSPSTLLL